MDLVVISLEAWDAVWRRNQHLIAGLLRRDASLRVLLVEPATDPLHALRRKARPRAGRGLRPGPPVSGVAEGQLWLFEPTKFLPRKVDRSVDARWAKGVVRAANSLGMSSPLLWVNDPTGALLLNDLGAGGDRVVYDITDDWTLADRSDEQRRRTLESEARLLDDAKEVVVCSPQLFATKGQHRDVTLIPNGVDLQAYSSSLDRPEDLSVGPIVMYVGTLHEDRLDVDASVATAQALGSAGTLVMIGPNALANSSTSRLTAAGVQILGPRRSDQIPSYLRSADVLVVPHVITPFTDSLDPIKLYEYQASGRPVVSTRVAGFRDVTDPRIVLADAAEFPHAVVRGLHSASAHDARVLESVGERPGVDWSDRVTAMQAVLERVGNE